MLQKFVFFVFRVHRTENFFHLRFIPPRFHRAVWFGAAWRSSITAGVSSADSTLMVGQAVKKP
jgi:hypothetical protein